MHTMGIYNEQLSTIRISVCQCHVTVLYRHHNANDDKNKSSTYNIGMFHKLIAYSWIIIIKPKVVEFNLHKNISMTLKLNQFENLNLQQS